MNFMSMMSVCQFLTTTVYALHKLLHLQFLPSSTAVHRNYLFKYIFALVAQFDLVVVPPDFADTLQIKQASTWTPI